MTDPDHLPALPVIDARAGGPLAHARLCQHTARALREECLNFFPGPSRAALPLLDRTARAWLRRSASPYVGEIAAIAGLLGVSGVWFLNGSYQWGCTTRATVRDGLPWLARTLDWPFPGLGRHAGIVRLSGPAGDYASVAWPGYVGALTAMAPGRFAIAINQAPMWRRTRHRRLRPFDLAANAIGTWRLRHMPPDHLVRQVMEQGTDFAAARAMLETTPLARPVIFTLVGTRADEACVIERTETSFATRTHDTVTANDWLEPRATWEGRVASHLFLTASPQQAAENNRNRRTAMAAWDDGFAGDGFAWVRPPVLNPCTRLAVTLCPARGELRAVGYELATRGEMPRPVTRPGVLETLAEAA